MAKKKISERQKFAMLTAAHAEERDLQELRDIADDVIESDFVPYTCLYNAQSIVTKDGEILQTIKITGTGFETTAQNGTLRQAIRRAIRECLPDASYAIWLHTLRRQQSLVGHTHFPDAFSSQLNQAWRSKLPSSISFVNELYITIVKAGEPAPLRDIKTFLQSVSPGRDRKQRTAELDRMAKALQATTHAMLAQLQPYGATLLTVVERDGIFYSEQMEFLEKLINLEERPMELPLRDLAHVLTSGEITFGYNAMEVRTHDGHRRFAAILSLKEYKESTLAGIDKFLEIPCEVIVSQCFSFTGAEMAQESYAKQARYLTISGDKELAQWIEIDRLMQMGDTGAQEYGQQQTSLFLISPSVRQLEANVRLVQRSLSRLGMIAVREDLRFEECYWAQLPGNFTFVVRQQPVDTEHLAGFANLQSAPMGVSSGSAWGPPVSLFTTVQDTPYFFNFQRGCLNHTVILGKPGSGRTSFMHFLLSQTRKLPVAIWYVDTHGRGGPFINAMGGSYVRPGTAQLKFNPFHMPETPANRDFLALWLATLLDPHGTSLNASTLAFFKNVVDDVLKMPRANRRLSAVLPIMREADPMLAQALLPFCAGGAYGEVFDMPEDTFTTSNLIAWDISAYYANPITRIPLVSYLLHRLTANLTGNPTLVVLDEGFSLLDTPLFATRATQWCDYLTAQNAACILSTDAIDASSACVFTSGIMQRTATLFAMADARADAEYAMGFGLTAEEISTLGYIARFDHHLLQKRGMETVILKTDLSATSPATRSTLSGRGKREDTSSPAEQLAALMHFGSGVV